MLRLTQAERRGRSAEKEEERLLLSLNLHLKWYFNPINYLYFPLKDAQLLFLLLAHQQEAAETAAAHRLNPTHAAAQMIPQTPYFAIIFYFN